MYFGGTGKSDFAESGTKTKILMQSVIGAGDHRENSALYSSNHVAQPPDLLDFLAPLFNLGGALGVFSIMQEHPDPQSTRHASTKSLFSSSPYPTPASEWTTHNLK